MTERVVVGRVGKPHGILGAFVVENASDAPERFAVGARLLVGGETATVIESKRSGGRRVIRVEGADGTTLGRVVNVEPGVANDVLELEGGLLLPLVGACVRQVDLERGRI